MASDASLLVRSFKSARGICLDTHFHRTYFLLPGGQPVREAL